MTRTEVRQRNPERYAAVMEEQATLRRQYTPMITMARLCPLCETKLQILYRGQHGACRLKCSGCGEEVTFPPCSFRLAG